MNKRRQFIHQLGASSVLAFLPGETKANFQESISSRDMTISEVDVLKVNGSHEVIPGLNKQFQSQAIHLYPELRPEEYRDSVTPVKQMAKTSQYFIRMRTKGGLEGIYGAIDGEVIRPILDQMKSFLIGKSAMDVEKIWDQLYRRNRHSRAGHYMMAISAVDNVLWDLRGKYFDVPVYQLLGGTTRDEITVYGSCLGFSVAEGKAGAQAKSLYDKGFKHQKWFTAYGPGDGSHGLKRTIDMVREIRESVGEDLQLMVDAYMAWDLPFAKAWTDGVSKYRPFWLEEAFPPDHLDAFTTLVKSTDINIATGEHFYSRWEVQNYLKAGVLIIQADPEWCGGVSELVKICHLSSAFGAKVFPHGHNIPAAMHVVTSQSPEVCPLVEYLINHVEHKMHFFKKPLLTDNGKLPLPQGPGFEIEIDPPKVDSMEALK